MKTCVLSQKTKTADLVFNHEFPYIEIRNVEIKNDAIVNSLNGVKLQFTSRSVEYTEMKSPPVELVSVIDNPLELNRVCPNSIDLITVKLLLIDVPEEFDEDFELIIEYSVEDLFVSLEGPFVEFENHIRKPFNSKILFSAPFGQGKTTFLREFFKDQYENYSDFWINVNQYSVSGNSDVIRYIKCDIICQLVIKGVEFDSDESSLLKTGKEFVADHFHQILGSFFLLVPQVGADLYKMFEVYDGLKSEYLKYHEDRNFRGISDMIKLVESIYDIDGGIYEQDFYTQLISKMLTKNAAKNNERNVLVIDDLDRIDPEHAFRILNVLSVHIDPVRATDEFNKFGFDKIIVVCDKENLKRIFEHRYGKGVDFKGYLNKYFSQSPFDFDNKKAIRHAIGVSRETSLSIRKKGFEYMFGVVQEILLDFHEVDELSLREILKLRLHHFTIDFEKVLSKLNEEHYNALHFITLVVEYLMVLTTPTELVQKFKRCFNANLRILGYFKTDVIMSYGLPYISESDDYRSDTEVELGFEQNPRKVNVSFDVISWQDGLYLHRAKIKDSDMEFNKRDFYSLCIQTVQKYERQRNVGYSK